MRRDCNLAFSFGDEFVQGMNPQRMSELEIALHLLLPDLPIIKI